MANLFLDIPLAAGQGPGAAVDVSTMGKSKTLVVGSVQQGSITIEISCDGVTWAPIATFVRPGKKVVDVAAKQMRSVKSNAAASGNVSVASDDFGAQFAALPLPLNVGPGPVVDVSDLGTFTTFTCQGAIVAATVSVQVSDDQLKWATCVTFDGAKRIESKNVVGRWMRTLVSRSQPNSPFSPVLAVGAINDGDVAISYGPPITVVGSDNLEGASSDASRADHQHRLELKVSDFDPEGCILVGQRPELCMGPYAQEGFVPVLPILADDAGGDSVRALFGFNIETAKTDLDVGAVIKRSEYLGNTVATSSASYVDGMSGTSVIAPATGTFLTIFEAEASAGGIGLPEIEIGVSVNSIVAVQAGSEREFTMAPSERREAATSVQLNLQAGDLVRCLFRKKSGLGAVQLRDRHLILEKVQ